jgi:hypothetical protein
MQPYFDQTREDNLKNQMEDDLKKIKNGRQPNENGNGSLNFVFEKVE